MPINIQREFATIGLSSGGGVFAPQPLPSGRLEASQAIGGATLGRFAALADAIDIQTQALVNQGQVTQRAGETVRVSSAQLYETFRRIEEATDLRRQRHDAKTKETQFLRDSADILARAEEQAGPSGVGLERRVRALQEERIEALLSGIPDEAFRAVLAETLSLIAVRNELTAGRLETRKEQAFLRGELDKRAGAYHAQAVQFRGPVQENLIKVMIEDYRDAVAEGLLTAVEGEKKIAAFRAAVADSTFKADIVSDPAEAARRFDDGIYDTLLANETERNTLGRKIQRALAHQQQNEATRKARAAQRAYLERIAELERGIEAGSVGAVEIDEARKAETLNARDALRLRRTAEQMQSTRAEEARLVQKASDAMAGHAVLDPRTREGRMAVDLHYARVVVSSLEGPDREKRLVDYVSSVGIVPTKLRSSVSGRLLNGTTQDRVQAAEFMDRLGEKKPILLAAFTEKERRLGALTLELVRAGMDADKAVTQASEAIFKVDDPERRRRLQEIRTEKHEGNVLNWVKDTFPNVDITFGFGGEEPSSVVLDDFAVLYREHYAATGDIEVAAKLARQDIRSVWGVTEIGRRRLVRYAPETVYGNVIDADHIAAQLLADVAVLEIAKARDAGRKVDEDDVFDDLEGTLRLVADSNTPHEHHPDTGAFWPAYAVLKDGQPLLDEAGVRLRWRPDVQNKLDHAKTQQAALAAWHRRKMSRHAGSRAKVLHRKDS